MRAKRSSATWRIIKGDCREVLKEFPDNHFDACVSDPPYGISFQGHKWDHQFPGPIYWEVIYEKLKPGAYALIFAAVRKRHRLVCVLEDVGFEHRTELQWWFAQALPKNKNIPLSIDRYILGESPKAATFESYEPKTEEAKKYAKLGTALRPSFEPIILIRKPCEGSLTENVLKYGTGGLNVVDTKFGDRDLTHNNYLDGLKPFGGGEGHPYATKTVTGNWPADIIMDPYVAGFLDGQSGQKYSQFFYTPKVNRTERDLGCEHLELIGGDEVTGRKKDSIGLNEGFAYAGTNKTPRRNPHPTLKPESLIKWLVQLVTPPGGNLVDPFAGSGTTGACSVLLDQKIKSVCIDLDEKSCEVSRAKHVKALERVGQARKEDLEKTEGKEKIQLGLEDFRRRG